MDTEKPPRISPRRALGLVAFLFFLLKGLVWLAAGVGLTQILREP
jgi:hypothetical protein